MGVDDEQAAAIDEALRAADRGAFISNEAMCAWLHSWGSDDELPPPDIDILKGCRSTGEGSAAT